MKRSLWGVVVAFLLSSFLLLIGCGGGTPTQTPNPPPQQVTFTSAAPTRANEGTAYTYSVQTNVVGASLELTKGPTGAVLSRNTLSWTPTAKQARTANDFALTAKSGSSTTVQNWSVIPTGYIRGVSTDTCITDTGQTSSIGGIGGSMVKVLVPVAGGGFDTHSATVAPDGSFSIPNIPAGNFWLLALYTNLWTDRSSINLGQRTWGGCTYEAPSGAGTSLQATVDGLNPWQYYDYFYFIVPNARSGTGASPLPSVGATSTSVNIPSGNLLLMKAANGDNGYFAQLVTSTYGGVEFHALERFYGPQAVTVQDGAVNSMAVTLLQVPQTSSVRANIKGSAFAALHDGMFPGSPTGISGYGFRIDISVDNVSPLSYGTFLLFASHAFTTDEDLGDVSYANPYPATWTPFLDYYDYAVHKIQPPGASAPFPFPLATRVVSTQLPTASSPIQPLVGPPLNPQIDGKSLFQDQVITGTSPVFSWDPPAVGTASGYRLRVNEVLVKNGTVSLDFKGFFYVAGTSVQLPPGVLASGKTYTFAIDSLYRSTDFAANPNLETFPEGESDLGTGLVTIQ